MSVQSIKKAHLIFFFITFFAFPAKSDSLPQTQLLSLTKVLSADDHPFADNNHFLSHKKILAELYFLSPTYLLWLNPDKLHVNSALQLIATADARGLNKEHYNLTGLQTQWQLLINQQSVSYIDLALLDTAISLNLIHFLSDLHFGRLNSKTLKLNDTPPKKTGIFIPLIIKAIKQEGLLQLANRIEPSIPAYHKLKNALFDYQNKQSEPLFLTIKYTASIRPGESSKQIIDIRKQLSLLGGSAEDNGDSIFYDQQLLNQIKKFQLRHGLKQDGVIGKNTIKALNIPLHQRTQQIKLALERLRWLPKLKQGPVIMVNIPAYQLWAYDSDKMDEQQAINMKVIVGKSDEEKRKSPIFTAKMRYLVFSPYWNIPKSITVKEILPKLLENPFYLEERNMEVVTGFHNNELALPYTDESFELLRSGALKLRQRPGNGNSLGRVKFIFPNNYNVYLHDTPSRFLFNRSKRDLSHGCIRVEKPSSLAQFVLKSKKGWNKHRISKAMHLQSAKKVHLKKSVTVIIYYSTASVVQDELIFYDDVYNYDPKLSLALNKSTKN